MVHSKFSLAVGFALSLSLTSGAQMPALAQAAPFKLPGSVAQGTNVRIDGSSSMVAVNQVLTQRFEKQYPGTQVTSNNAGTPEGLQALLDGKVDLAAIGRPLTAQEKAKGLEAVPVGRDKIAIVVGSTNSFAKSLNIGQFAKMFRGEIKNWSEVGGAPAAIRFVDRPDSSDTRQAFREYPVFKQGKFATGTTTEKLKNDTTQAAIRALGKNGISYTTANQIKNQPGVKAVVMHGTPPTDPRYPFSQPLYYVYNAGNPTPAAQAFLGFATAPVGQSAIAQAGVAEAINASKKPDAIAPATTTQKGALPTLATNDSKVGVPENLTGAVGTTSGEAVSSNTANPATGAGKSGAGGGGLFGFLPSLGGDGVAGKPGGLNGWWLFPIASGAGLLWLLGRSGRDRAPASGLGTDQVQEETYGQGFAPPEPDSLSERWVGTSDTETRWDDSLQDLPSDRLAHEQAGDAFQSPGLTEGGVAPIPGETLTGKPTMGDAISAGGVGAAAWSAFGGRDNSRGVGRVQVSRVLLKARSPQEVEAYWEVAPEQMRSLRQQGGNSLAIRLYDVTDIDLDTQSAHSVQQFDCDELTHRQRLAIATPDRDYLAELGSLAADGRWIALARSAHVHVPPSSTFLGNAAQAGGAALAGGAIHSGQSFLADDHDSAVEQPAPEPWTSAEAPSSADGETLFGRLTHRAADSADMLSQAGGTAAATGAAAWSFLSGKQNADAPPPSGTAFGDGSEVGDANPAVERYDSPAIPNSGAALDGSARSQVPGQIGLTPRSDRWAYASWDVPRSQRAAVDRMDQNLVLRLYDVTDINLEQDSPEQFQQFDVDDLALSCDLPIPESNRSYIVELGYAEGRDRWTVLARSTPVWIAAN
ncbi:DUF4912 domain-containing protein [Myxacorys almedinensis]|uniref:DUF4912 domain-containing protein n=1 Tax=Myxacorys almedinensis A TaxID=2690445 RepID=A0A8J7Z6J2_9CYAN|nr:DUF4912 domain-containing protein [Myxacorys almedinensis]NDJ19081.1 DUF4912 domain-containing protein [Myxacorys almedinensis A]